jgi:TorA maturation chaperone TorD
VTRALPVIDGDAERFERSLLGRADLLLWLAELLARPRPLARVPLEAAALGTLFAHAQLPEALALDLMAAAETGAEYPGDAWDMEYERLFGPELQCPIYETAYVRRDKGAVLGDVAGFYRAFGFASRGAERPDHLCAELELTAMLCLSLLRARSERNAQAAQVVEEALSAFLADHLGEWLPSFALTLEQRAELPLYRELGRILQLTAASLGCAEPASSAGEPAPSADTPYECGMATREAAEPS